MTIFRSNGVSSSDVHVLAMEQIGRNPRTEVERTIHTANYLIAYLTNDGVGAYFAMYKEDDPEMTAAATAMRRIGADAVVPPLLRANAAHDAYCEAEDDDEVEQNYVRVSDEAEREIAALGLDLRELLRDFIRREYPLGGQENEQ